MLSVVYENDTACSNGWMRPLQCKTDTFNLILYATFAGNVDDCQCFFFQVSTFFLLREKNGVQN